MRSRLFVGVGIIQFDATASDRSTDTLHRRASTGGSNGIDQLNLLEWNCLGSCPARRRTDPGLRGRRINHHHDGRKCHVGWYVARAA